MKKERIVLFTLILLNLFLLPGCWSYREIDDLSIVSGVAIDKGINGKYAVTPEIVHIEGGKETKLMGRTITMEGKSMFDAVRNGISVAGKRLYWSHTKVVIVSQEIAREGMTKIVDWFTRDAETREDVYIIVSRGETAKEMLQGYTITDTIVSYELERILDNQKSLSKAPDVDLWEFANNISAIGISSVAPAISIMKVNGEVKAQIEGTAIFKEDKLIGFIDGEDTQMLLFIQNRVSGGVVVCEELENTYAALEIFKSKTKIKPISNGKDITMDIKIDMNTAIDEVGGDFDLIQEEGRNKLREHCEGAFNERVTQFIKKIQSQYGSDIFGFGAKIWEDKPYLWQTVSQDWEEEFKKLKVNVDTKINIKNSAQISKTIGAEE